jgi:hypothetical protein
MGGADQVGFRPVLELAPRDLEELSGFAGAKQLLLLLARAPANFLAGSRSGPRDAPAPRGAGGRA